MIGNKIADKMKEKKAKKIIEICISPEKIQKIIEDINHSWLGEYKILDFNLNEQNKKGQGLKILTPDQMLSRLSIILETKFRKFN